MPLNIAATLLSLIRSAVLDCLAQGGRDHEQGGEHAKLHVCHLLTA
jgi:hypothetical protein